MRVSITCAALMALAMACAKDKDDREDSAAGSIGATTSAATPTPAPAPALTAENVLAKMAEGDSAEVALGKLVETKATNAGVKSFARLLVTDHGAALREVAAVEKKASLTPQPASSDTSAQENQNTLSRFQAMPKGKDFDTAFVNLAVEDHQKEISELQSVQSTVQQADLQALISKTLPVMQKHLDRAQALQKQLSGAK